MLHNPFRILNKQTRRQAGIYEIIIIGTILVVQHQERIKYDLSLNDIYHVVIFHAGTRRHSVVSQPGPSGG